VGRRDEHHAAESSKGLLDEILPSLADYYQQCRKILVSGRTQRELEHLREQFGGTFRKDAYTDHFPKVAFKSGGQNAVLAVWPRKADLSEFQVNLAFSNPGAGSQTLPYPTVEIFSHGLARTVVPAKGLSRITLSDSLFDHHFFAQAQSDAPARRILVPEARQRLMELYCVSTHHNLYVGLEFERVLLKKYTHANDLTASLLADLSDGAQRLIEVLLRRLTIEEADRDALEILSVSFPAEIVRCQVCGESIVLDRIECRRCETPHHRDCWDYNGRCAVYGCGESHFRIPA